jgi:hypothetical protein
LILQGVLFTQFAHYAALYEGDTLLLRAFVAGLALITTAKTAHGLSVFPCLSEIFSEITVLKIQGVFMDYKYRPLHGRRRCNQVYQLIDG